tara:strand:- start:2437 stop:3084 length:648 start_codon:yes stop_codon:yes gene_type:complete
MTPVLLPIKELQSTKSRLAVDLPRRAVELVTVAMLKDLVECMRNVPEVDTVFVVTPDKTLANIAIGRGAEAMLIETPGLNPSLDVATQRICSLGASRVLITLGDVAGALPKEVSKLFRSLDEQGGKGVVLAPSGDGGSSALLRAPADALPNRFGKDSASTHRDLVKKAGMPYTELNLPSMVVDLDRVADVAALLANPGAKYTKQVLNGLDLERKT